MTNQEQSAQAEVQRFMDHIEYTRPDLVDQVKTGQLAAEPTGWWQQRFQFAKQPLQWLKGAFLADPDQFHGKAYVTKELKGHSRLTAGIVSGSGIYDYVTNASLFFLAFKSIGFWGLPLSLLVNQLLLKIGNDSAAVASGHKPSMKPWASAGIFGLVSVNIIQSLFSVVGMELLLNPTGIAELKAVALIQEHEQKIEGLRSLSNPRLETAQQQCQQNKQKLDGMAENDPMRNSIIRETDGLWSQQGMDWSQVPESALPFCRLAERLEQEALKPYDNAKNEWEAMKAKRLELGNDVTFLRGAVPDLYAFHFDQNGEMRSSIEATGYAALNLRNKFVKGDWPGLALPLFFWSLSISTSALACVLTIRHARRRDTQMSRSALVERERDRWLEQQFQALSSEHPEQK